MTVLSSIEWSGRRYRVLHRTTYWYGASMTDAYTVAHLLLRDTPWQLVESTAVQVTPDADRRDEYVDLFGNRIVQMGVHHLHDHVVIEAEGVARVVDRGEVVDDTPWEVVVAGLREVRGFDALEVGPFVGRSHHVDAPAIAWLLQDLVDTAFSPGRGVVDAARALCTAIFEGFVYDPTATDTSTPLVDVVTARRGVCQDFAHLAMACLRLVGLPARYVSGYLETEPPPGVERLVGADASHAWCSVWTPRAGWVDFDPTNGHLPVNRHVTAAWGRDYADVTPVRGVVIGPNAQQRLEVAVDVALL
jgi:transglutaminase-like putative cysteine protease